MPVFCFGISQALNFHATSIIIVFIALHFFIYPGSNIYNSYMDKDEGSIGGLEKPPPVTRKLYYASIIVDTLGLLICLFAGWKLTLLLAGYVAFSKAYSWYGIRLKKYTYLGWISVAFFQGGYTFLIGNMAAEGAVNMQWFTAKNLLCMLIATLFIGASYPFTQIYQHEEDSARGDITISYKLGIIGTFILAGSLFFLAALIAWYYFMHYYTFNHFLIFLLCMIPIVGYYSYWFRKTLSNRVYADYKHTMLMNKISSVFMIICFTILLFVNYKR
ncbi:MAG: UbiA family prenyltransferase [Flavipsychrobacter sp.]